jgi:hypothetical protein
LPNTRIYCALEEQTLFNVQSMIRLDNVRFQQPLRRTRASESPQWYQNSEFTLSNDVYQRLVNSL